MKCGSSSKQVDISVIMVLVYRSPVWIDRADPRTAAADGISLIMSWFDGREVPLEAV